MAFTKQQKTVLITRFAAIIRRYLILFLKPKGSVTVTILLDNTFLVAW
jgi:hypothetical protein